MAFFHVFDHRHLKLPWQTDDCGCGQERQGNPPWAEDIAGAADDVGMHVFEDIGEAVGNAVGDKEPDGEQRE